MPYKELFDKVKNVCYLGSAGGILGWDQEVMMPKKGVEMRAHQFAALSSVVHDMFTSKQIGKLIRETKKEKLNEAQQVNLKELEKDYRKSTKIPTEHVAMSSKVKTHATEVWREARAKGDFKKFAPHLQKILDIEQKTAKYINPRKFALDVHLEDNDESLTCKKVDVHFKKIKKAILQLLKHKHVKPELKGTYDVAKQEKLCREVATKMGFDWDRGRMDVSTHPFTTGNTVDTRITTRYDPKEPFQSVLAAVHETGHALYDQGLPFEHYGTAQGEAASLSTHESQSRIWENHLSRGKEFWQWLSPLMQKEGWNLSSEQCYGHVNAMVPGFIRVDADEVSYHMHVIMRFEIERGLFDGSIKVKDVPDEWNSRMQEYLGLKVPNNSQGCLQDIHWTSGFGYFPTYSIGTMIAAQLWEKANKKLKFESDFSQGKFTKLTDWLKTNIHQHGRRYAPDELIKKATGDKPNPAALIAHLRSKHTP
ncbi:MAG: carboxypeptidase M32 [Candidatus Woesearchaeota archaeon]|jgi:carboxypeptidase Taq|nr:carboxypeptidase M32 [Candidatus Woesearchaeota archaeon]MDP7199270.1 carboxypeptidase M32 [Candidatus Woesearchaeota archaeon]MDP7467923.1 carboxypeptidase M32 [Candidatus Woesearchaeota archaeon]MDP7647873.1 carboxypeptidase M32 [Candidatus Woesearchaeota archaeon]